MKKSWVLVPAVILVLIFVSLLARAESESTEGIDPNLQNLSGCFDVTFRYVEDGVNDVKIEQLVEWVTVQQVGDRTSLQHIGIVQGQVFKHWREEWAQEKNGAWTQKVVGPFEDFRYVCTASWYMNQWRCSVTGAPKPRRDEKRDYATLDRENTLQVTPRGWVHAQNNKKRRLDGSVLSVELGWNEYKRVDDSKCDAARKNPPKQ